MGSSYFGEPNLGNERGGSSRKGKKSNSDKPKQPQRGLGVAQLEKIRLHGQMGSGFHPSLHGSYASNFNQVALSLSLSLWGMCACWKLGYGANGLIKLQEDIRMQSAYSSVPSSSFSYSSSSAASYGYPNIMVCGLVPLSLYLFTQISF